MTQNRQELVHNTEDSRLSVDDILSEYRSGSAEPSPTAPAPVEDTYVIPEPPVEKKKSSLPSEEEVRAYMAAFARGEYRTSEKPEEVDSRFLTREDRQRRGELTYAGRRVDMSAEESYEPPKAPEYISHYAPEGDGEPEAEEETDAPPRFAFVKRWQQKLERQHIAAAEKEAARKAAAEKLRYPEPEELVLPGEEPETEEQAEEPTQVFQPVTPEPEPEPAYTPSWSRSAASHKEYASAFPDTSASPAIYAGESDYDYDEDEGGVPDDEAEELRREDFFPSSFKEYLFSMLTSLLYRLRGAAAGTLTAEEDDEELGPELPAANASKYYGSHLRSQKLRLRISGILLVVLAWISLGLPVSGRLNDIHVASLLCLGFQLSIMLLSLDVVTGGVMNAVRRKPGADSMAVLACLVTSIDALLSAKASFAAAHMPLCLISSLSLTGVLFASYTSCRGLRKALRVPAIAKRSYTVTGETNVKSGDITLLKSVRPSKGFVRRTEEAAPDETLFQKLFLPLLALVVLLTLIVMIAKKNVADVFYILSVLLCPAVPFAALFCFALPFFTGSVSIFSSGAAIAGWSGLCDIGRSKNLIITDRDLFPEGSVEIESIRIFADAQPEKIIAYAGSMLTACGSSVSGCFGELMERNGCAMRQIENFEYLPGGGMKGIIDSSVILCGSSDLMQLMNVRIPFRLVNRTSVLLAVDGILYGIFNMKYTPDPKVRSALMGLMRSGRHPVFAIRDFNVTPAMLHDCFDVATDGYDFPPYVERFAMSSADPGQDSKVAAVVCRDGLGPLSHMADVGRRMYMSVRVSLMLTAFGTLIGVLAAFFRLLSLGGVSVGFLFVFMLLWALPVAASGVLLRLDT